MNSLQIILPYFAMVTMLMAADDFGGALEHYSRESNPGPLPGSQSVFLTGKVVLSDGSALPDHALIVLVCTHASYPQGYTNSKGQFGFVAGQIPDVSMVSGLTNCDLEASLPGFRSDSISLAGHRYLDDPDLGSIVLHPLVAVEGLTVSAISALAPKEAHKAYESGMEDEKKLRNTDAQRHFEKAVSIYPKYASAWLELGRLSELASNDDAARKAYSQAVSADPKFLKAYERLYALGVKKEDWEEVAEATGHLLRLNPYQFPAAYYYNAVANLKLHRLDAAEKSGRQAAELDNKSRTPQADYVLGMIFIQERNFVDAAKYLRTFLNEAPEAPNAAMVRKQLVEVEKLAQGLPR